MSDTHTAATPPVSHVETEDVAHISARAAGGRGPGVRAVGRPGASGRSLTVPVPDGGIVVWGKGFEADHVGALPWLRDAAVHYWGDLDTHGFAILDKLRAWLPHTRSFLMDRATLLAHRDRWVVEGSPTSARLDRLEPAEAHLYDDLVADRLAGGVRLEQERIDWAWARDRLPYA